MYYIRYYVNVTNWVLENYSHLLDTLCCLCCQSELGMEQQEVGDECVKVFGIKRTLHSVDDNPKTWHCHFMPDG